MLFLFLIILLIGYCIWETFQLTEKHYTFTKQNTSEKIKIAQLSDSHFSRFYAPQRFDKIIDNLAQQQPDLVLFTGDLIENYRYWQKHDPKKIIQQLQRISAPLGKFAILGNHDYRTNGETAVTEILTAAGFTVLKNQTLPLNSQISLSGITDSQGSVPDYQLTPAEAQWKILLLHEPDQVKDVQRQKDFDLILCGHSHGGQIHLPFFVYKNTGSSDYQAGRYDLPQTTLIVNTGLGTTGPPLRFRVKPEIIYLELKPAKQRL